MSGTHPRRVWVDAVRRSTLPPLQRLAARTMADHADADGVTWVALPRLTAETGMRRTAAAEAVRGLQAAGWLVVVEKARQRRAPRYRLTVPPPQGVASRHPEGDAADTPGCRQSDAQSVASRHGISTGIATGVAHVGGWSPLETALEDDGAGSPGSLVGDAREAEAFCLGCGGELPGDCTCPDLAWSS